MIKTPYFSQKTPKLPTFNRIGKSIHDVVIVKILLAYYLYIIRINPFFIISK